MKINFTKMQGAANDYIYVNCMDKEIDNPGELAKAMSPRHFSVGADGLIMICRSDIADAKMRMFNADGSEGRMCGNAIRCVGKYLFDNGIVKNKKITVETLSGIKVLTLTVTDGKASEISVDMGVASFKAEDIPLSRSCELISEEVTVNGETVRMTAVSMGNPHTVVFTDDVDSLDLEKIGPYYENHPLFPMRVNTEFIEVISPTRLKMRVWERGSGETWACGTGACAAVSAAVKNNICKAGVPVTVSLRGGLLHITTGADYRVFMRGNAVKVYDGVYEYEAE